MIEVRSFLEGAFRSGTGEKVALVNPATEVALATVQGMGEVGSALEFARKVGGHNLYALSFRERAGLLRGAQQAFAKARDELIGLAVANGGNTRSDAKFDVDGAIGTLAYYAEIGEKLGDRTFLVDGESVPLGRSARAVGQHVLVPRTGVAVLIGAFNFPAWGFAEKAAQAWLAGMPVLTKPATSTALVAFRMIEILVEENVLPEGACSFLAGAPGDLLLQTRGQDVIAFTGSSATGAMLRRLANVVEGGVRVGIEADSLNAAVMGPDVTHGSPTYDLFVQEIAREMTQKAGQKCTAVRRILVPSERVMEVTEDLAERLSRVKVGDPANEAVTMGPLATAHQLADVRARCRELAKEAKAVFGGEGLVSDPIGGAPGKGYFFGPVLLSASDPHRAESVHSVEAFGPVATILPYDGRASEAVELVRRGEGGLVASAYSDDRTFLRELFLGAAPFHGRLYVGSAKIAGQTAGPGTVLPQLVHGGPGRAGGGEELGGLRGMAFYMQRTAVQGDKLLLEQILG